MEVVFATTRSTFEEAELDLFTAFAESTDEHEFLRRAPILMTAAELEAAYPWSDEARGPLRGHRRIESAVAASKRILDDRAAGLGASARREN